MVTSTIGIGPMGARPGAAAEDPALKRKRIEGLSVQYQVPANVLLALDEAGMSDSETAAKQLAGRDWTKTLPPEVVNRAYDIADQLYADKKPAAAAQSGGMGQAFGVGIDQLQQSFGSAVEGVGRATGIDALANYGADVAARNAAEAQAGSAGLQRMEDVNGLGSAAQFAGETVAQNAPQMGLSFGSGAAGAAAGAAIGSVVPVIGTGLGAVAGGLIGSFAPNLAMAFGQNRERQKEARIAEGKAPVVDEGTAFAAAVPQAALDAVADRFIVGKLIPPGALKTGGVFTRIAKNAATGALTEVPTEIGQQMIERAQAGLDLTSDDAIKEYVQAGVAAGILGGGVGGIAGAVNGGEAKPQAGTPDAQTAAPLALPSPTGGGTIFSGPYTPPQAAPLQLPPPAKQLPAPPRGLHGPTSGGTIFMGPDAPPAPPAPPGQLPAPPAVAGPAGLPGPLGAQRGLPSPTSGGTLFMGAPAQNPGADGSSAGPTPGATVPPGAAMPGVTPPQAAKPAPVMPPLVPVTKPRGPNAAAPTTANGNDRVAGAGNAGENPANQRGGQPSGAGASLDGGAAPGQGKPGPVQGVSGATQPADAKPALTPEPNAFDAAGYRPGGDPNTRFLQIEGNDKERPGSYVARPVADGKWKVTRHTDKVGTIAVPTRVVGVFDTPEAAMQAVNADRGIKPAPAPETPPKRVAKDAQMQPSREAAARTLEEHKARWKGQRDSLAAAEPDWLADEGPDNQITRKRKLADRLLSLTDSEWEKVAPYYGGMMDPGMTGMPLEGMAAIDQALSGPTQAAPAAPKSSTPATDATPDEPASGTLAAKWDSMPIAEREALVMASGWTVQDGSRVNPTGRAIAKRAWSEQNDTTRATLVRNVGKVAEKPSRRPIYAPEGFDYSAVPELAGEDAIKAAVRKELDGPEQTYTTRAGKTLTGIIVTNPILTPPQAKDIDSGAFRRTGDKGAGWFIRKDRAQAYVGQKPDAPNAAPGRDIITPADDKPIGKNAKGEALYERADGSRYRMRMDRSDRPQGYPDFGGDLVSVDPPAPAPAKGILSVLSDEDQRLAADIMKKLADKARNQLSSGIDPEYFTLGGQLVGLYIKAGTKRFAQMLKDFAASTGLSLKEAQAPMRAAYNYARDTMALEGKDTSGMDSSAAVMAEVRRVMELDPTPTEAEAAVDAGLSRDTKRKALTTEQVAKIGTDAKLFQYKDNGDESGVTERLQGVTTWDEMSAGIAMVFEYADGRMVIADGHQRLGLAKRLQAQGKETPWMAFVFRESEGFTPAKVRRLAALRNIREGSGTAIDAAKVLREAPADAETMNLPPKSALVRDARALAKLSDDAFGMVINEVAPVNLGAVVGSKVSDPRLHKDILSLLVREKPANTRQAEIIAEMAAANTVTETQTSLFGDEDVQANLYSERAKILDNALSRLRQDRATFKVLEKRAGVIAEAGNVLNAEANAARIEADAKTEAYLRAEANRKGPISDALTDAARKLRAEPRSIARIADEFERAVKAWAAGDNPPGGQPGGGADDRGGSAPQGVDGQARATEERPDPASSDDGAGQTLSLFGVDPAPAAEKPAAPAPDFVDRFNAGKLMGPPDQWWARISRENEGREAVAILERAGLGFDRVGRPWRDLRAEDQDKIIAAYEARYAEGSKGQDRKAYPTTLEEIAPKGRYWHIYAAVWGQRFYLDSVQGNPDARANELRLDYPGASIEMTDRADGTSINGDANALREWIPNTSEQIKAIDDALDKIAKGGRGQKIADDFRARLESERRDLQDELRQRAKSASPETYDEDVQRAALRVKNIEQRILDEAKGIKDAPAFEPGADGKPQAIIPGAEGGQDQKKAQMTARQKAEMEARQRQSKMRKAGGNDGEAGPLFNDGPKDLFSVAASDADPNPTPAQAEAGNYRKGHASWQGLDLTIETERLQERRGVDADGNVTWRVKMPAHYGYIKRTSGADGEQVDFYMGPEPDSDVVVVVDQVDAETRAFDEHKVMLGFSNQKAALDTYVLGFSDGKGPDRLGAHKIMTVADFKDWLANGDLTKPVRLGRETGTETALKRETPMDGARRSFSEQLDDLAEKRGVTITAEEKKRIGRGRGNAEDIADALDRYLKWREIEASGPAKYDDLSYEAGAAAYRNMSHSPEKRSESDIRSYVEDVNTIYRENLALAKTDEQKRILEAQINRFRNGYIGHMNSMWAAKGRTASWAVTGAARFPVAQNNKRMETERKRGDEFLEWHAKAKSAVRRAVLDARPDEMKADDRWKGLEAEIRRSVGYITDQSNKGWDPALFKQNLQGKIERLAKNGEVDLVQRAIAFLREAPATMGLSKPVFTDRSSIWTLPDVAAKAAGATQAAVEGGPTAVAEFDGATIIRAPGDDRVRIVFDQRISKEIAAELKGEGWKWSPTNTAWQRKLTNAAEYSATRIVGKHFTKKATDGGALEMRGEGDTFAADVLTEIAAVDDLFRYPKSGATTIQDAMADIDPGVTFVGDATRPDEAGETGAEQRFLLRTHTGSDFYVYQTDEDVWIDVSRLESGDGGSAIYAAAADYAAATGRVLIGDPAGLSDQALIRRTEAMLSSALKHGTTRHLKPHKRQQTGDMSLGVRPLRWTDGKDVANLQSLIEASASNVFAALPISLEPQVASARFDFQAGAFRDAQGRLVPDGVLRTWGDQLRRSRSAGGGYNTVKRTILLNTLLRGTGQEARPAVLERVLRQSRNVGAALRGTFYMRGATGSVNAAEFSPATRPDDPVTDADLRALTQELNAMPELSRLAGKVTVRAVRRLISHVTGNDIQGRFNPDKGNIEVRAGAEAGERGVMRHEVIHALRSSTLWGTPYGLFTREEWTGLVRAARSEDAIVASVKRRYPDANPSLQSEEMVAEFYREWAAMRDGYSGVEKALVKIEGFLTALANALRGRGFQSTARTLDMIASGKMGGRGPNGPGRGGKGAANSETLLDAASAEMRASDVADKFSGLIGSSHWRKPGEFMSDLLTDAMANGRWSVLGLVPGRALFSELAKNLPSAKRFLDAKDAMDAERNEWHVRGAEVIDRWAKAHKSDPATIEKLHDIMFRVTISGVDPRGPDMWEQNHPDVAKARDEVAKKGARASATARKRVKEADDRAKTHAIVKAEFDTLPQEAKDIFSAALEALSDLDKEGLAALEKSIKDNAALAMKRAEKEYKKTLAQIRDQGFSADAKAEAEEKARVKLEKARSRFAADQMGETLQSLRKQFESARLQGPYFPLYRSGQYFAAARDSEGTLLSFQMMDSVKKQRAAAAQLQTDFPGAKVSFGLSADRDALREIVDPRFVADVESLLADSGASDGLMDAVWQRYLQTMPEQSLRTNALHRKAVAGYNQDALRAFANHMFHGAHQTMRLKYAAELEKATIDAMDQAAIAPDRNRAEAVAQEMARRKEWVLAPQNAPWVSWVSGVTFVWYLGASPAAALVNVTQTTIIGPAVMKAKFKGATVPRILRELGRASNDFAQGRGVSWSDTWSAENAKTLTDDEKAAIREGYRQAVIDKTQGHDNASVAESGVEYNSTRERVMRLIGFAYHHAERFNREVTYLAAYRMARDEGLDFNAAVAKAKAITWDIHFSYINSDRPRFMQGDFEKVIFAFKQYSVNLIWRLWRDTHQAFNGATPEDRAEARTQLIGITLSMFAHAGIKGVWGYGLIMALLALFLPGDTEEHEEWLERALIAEGDDVGTAAWNFIMGSALNGVPGQLSGIALTNRIGSPDLWFRTPSSDLEGEDLAWHYTQGIVGPALGIFVGALKGASYASDGQIARGIEAATPKFISDIVKTGRFATEGATTLKGDPILENLNPWDLFVQMNGFTPARLDAAYEDRNFLYLVQDKIETERRNLHRKATDAILTKKPISGDVLAEITAFNKKYPFFAITSQSVKQSFRARQQASSRTEGGVNLNPKLDVYLRKMLAEPYR